LFGTIADVQGVQITLLVAAGLLALTILIGMVIPLPAARDLNLALREWTEPETAVSVDDRSGPIVVTIEYRIAPEDITHFLNVMHERRRIAGATAQGIGRCCAIWANASYGSNATTSPPGSITCATISRSEEHTSELQSREKLVCR